MTLNFSAGVEQWAANLDHSNSPRKGEVAKRRRGPASPPAQHWRRGGTPPSATRPPPRSGEDLFAIPVRCSGQPHATLTGMGSGAMAPESSFCSSSYLFFFTSTPPARPGWAAIWFIGPVNCAGGHDGCWNAVTACPSNEFSMTSYFTPVLLGPLPGARSGRGRARR
jgi:hypothetical protein